MALDYRRLRAVTAREIGAALVRDGFKLGQQSSGLTRIVRARIGRTGRFRLRLAGYFAKSDRG